MLLMVPLSWFRALMLMLGSPGCSAHIRTDLGCVVVAAGDRFFGDVCGESTGSGLPDLLS